MALASKERILADLRELNCAVENMRRETRERSIFEKSRSTTIVGKRKENQGDG